MIWKALIPLLRPLVPVAVDYARARMRPQQQSPARPDVVDVPFDPLEARLANAEAQLDVLSRVSQEYAAQLEALSAATSAKLKSARSWTMLLLAWNLVLTVVILVLLLR